jgi:hypothetical protein
VQDLIGAVLNAGSPAEIRQPVIVSDSVEMPTHRIGRAWPNEGFEDEMVHLALITCADLDYVVAR